MTERPTPESRAAICLDDVGFASLRDKELALQWVARAIEIERKHEREEADRRVAEARASSRRPCCGPPGKPITERDEHMFDRGKQAGIEQERQRGDALERACHHLAGRLTEVERGRDQLRAQVAVEKRAWARVHEALGIKPDGLAGILGTIEELKEERATCHLCKLPIGTLDTAGLCMCVTLGALKEERAAVARWVTELSDDDWQSMTAFEFAERVWRGEHRK